jgi:hypothetical protein
VVQVAPLQQAPSSHKSAAKPDQFWWGLMLRSYLSDSFICGEFLKIERF